MQGRHTTIVVPGRPVARPRQRVARRGGHVFSYTPASHPVVGYKASIVAAWKQAGARQLAGPVAVTITAFMPQLKRMPKRMRQAGPTLHARRPDIDNIVKAVLDALNGHAYRNDGQVAVLVAVKRECGLGELPRTEISVRPVTLEEIA